MTSKRKSNKIWHLLAMLVIVFGICAGLGTTAYAEDVEIIGVEICGITMPIEGKTPDYEGNLTYNDDCYFASNSKVADLGYSDPEYFKTGIQWQYHSYSYGLGYYGNYSTMHFSDTFKGYYDGLKPYKYRFKAVLVPKPGYKFASTVRCTINEDENLVATYRSYGTSLYIESVDFTALSLITDVDVSDITTPVEYERANYFASTPYGAHWHLAKDDEIPDNSLSDVTKNGICWWDRNTMQYITPQEYFLANHAYKVDVILVPDEQAIFADEVNCTINKGKIPVAWSYKEKDALVIVSKEMVAEDAPFRRVDVSGITLPVHGQKPDYSGTLPSTAKYRFANYKQLADLGYTTPELFTAT